MLCEYWKDEYWNDEYFADGYWAGFPYVPPVMTTEMLGGNIDDEDDECVIIEL